MTVNAARKRVSARLRAAGVDAPLLDVNVLLGHVLNVDPIQVPINGDRHLTLEETQRFEELVRRRESREPVAYIIGHRAFADGAIQVTPDVLVPRPETETLVHATIRVAHELRPRVLVEVGTGSGAIAVAVARALPDLSVIASDLSQQALRVALRNVRDWGLGTRIQFARADAVRTFDLSLAIVAANLPYVSRDTLRCLAPEVARWEPREALDGGPDGLDVFRRFLNQVAHKPPRALLLEIGHDQRTRVSALAANAGMVCHEVYPDLAGWPRVLEFRPAEAPRSVARLAPEVV